MLSLGLVVVLVTGCGGNQDSVTETTTQAQTSTAPTVTAATRTVPAGIVLDPNLQSKTGTPAPEEMKALINLQKKVPYPVMVPTDLPSGLILEADLIGSGKPAGDPVGYYSFKYSDSANPNRFLIFNQTRANNRALSGYYLTEEEINGATYQVYWHKTLEYLPEGEPVRTGSVGDAETFIITWRLQYTGPGGTVQELYYGLSTGTWTGLGWWDMEAILEGLKPLGEVGQ